MVPSEAQQACSNASTNCKGDRLAWHVLPLTGLLQQHNHDFCQKEECSLLYVKAPSGAPWEKVCVRKHFLAWELRRSPNTPP